MVEEINSPINTNASGEMSGLLLKTISDSPPIAVSAVNIM
jgi:hypothetical protein